MGTGYTRNDTGNNIADGNIISASDIDGEYDSIEAAFNESTGHTHDGTAAEGAPITVLGPVQDFIASATEIKPKTTNTLDIGTASLQFKDMYLEGTAYLDDIQAVGAVDITGDLDVDNININGNTISSTDTNGNINLVPNGTGEVNLTDNDKLTFGAGSDLQIYHDGSQSYIKDAGTGQLRIAASDILFTNAAVTENIMFGAQDGAVTLYHNGASKLATTATGVDVTGVITTDGLTTSADITFGDNDKAVFGAGSDLEIYSDGANAVIDHTNTGAGALYLKGDNNVIITNQAGTENKAVFASNGAVTLYYDNASKLSTTATGIDVTGQLAVSDVNARIRLFETDTTDLNTQLQNQAGVFNIQTLRDDASLATSIVSIDHSTGNVLVNKTAANFSAAGTTFYGGSFKGLIHSARDGNSVLNLNRLTNDGEIIQLNKDGTTVGSIASRVGLVTNLILDPRTPSASSGAGLSTGSANILPSDSSGLTTGKSSLGDSNNRFKDLFLSGGVNFGTTGGNVTSKTLDDYEEGTWTPTIAGSGATGTASYSNQVGRYTKIGRQIILQWYVSWTSHTGTGTLRVTGLPAASVSGNFAIGNAMIQNIDIIPNVQIGPYLSAGSDIINLYSTRDNTSWANQSIDAAGSIVGYLSYHTS